MSVHSPSILKRTSNSEKKSNPYSKSREVLELESILADLQDSPLKNATPNKNSPCRVRCSPRTTTVQKSLSPLKFKRNLEKDYFSPSIKLVKIDPLPSPKNNSNSSNAKPTDRINPVSPHKLNTTIGNSPKAVIDKNRKKQINYNENLEDGDKDCISSIKKGHSSNFKHLDGNSPVSSQKLSITKKDTKKLKEEKVRKKQTSHSEKFETNDIAEMLEDSDDDDVSIVFDTNPVHDSDSDDDSLSSADDRQTKSKHSPKLKNRKQDLSKIKLNFGFDKDDDDIIILEDLRSPRNNSSKFPSKKKDTLTNNSKDISTSKKPNRKADPKILKLKKDLGFDDEDIFILDEFDSCEKNPQVSSKKKKAHSSRKDSQSNNKTVQDTSISTRNSKVRRSLLKEHEATYSIADCSQSPLRLKLKRKATNVSTPNDNAEVESDEEPLTKMRKSEPLKYKPKAKTATTTSDTEDDDIDSCDDKPLIKAKRSVLLKLKRKASTVTAPNDNAEDESDDEPSIKLRKIKHISNIDDESDDDDEPVKVRKMDTDNKSIAKPPEKSLRCRDSIKLPKWRLMDELEDIKTSKSPTKSPKINSNSPKKTLITPVKSTRNLTPRKNNAQGNDSPSKFDELIAFVRKKHGNGKDRLRESEPLKRLRNDDDYVLDFADKPLKNTPLKNGLSKSTLSPKLISTKTASHPLESSEPNSRLSRSNVQGKDTTKIENDTSSNLSKKLSNKENLINHSSKGVSAKDKSKSPSTVIASPQKRTPARQILNSPLKLNSPAHLSSDDVPNSPKKSKKTVENVESSLDNARIQLMVSAVPKSLPCRDKEFNNIYSFLGRKIEDFAGGCMYISGVPGTGKTATVHAVIRKLQDDVENEQLSSFNYVEINSLRLTEPRQAYTRILQSLTGQKLPSEQALRMLDKKFSGKERKSTILLVDELDYLCNRRQDVIYSILEWPMRQGSGVIVLTIANTMDLPERTLKGKVTSRMGLTRLTFQPYTHHQLQEIVMNRLIGNNSFHPDAVQLVARKVAAVSGDARRALDICRRATELVSPSKKGESTKTVTIQHVEKAVSQISSGRRILAIRACSTMAQLVLRALRDETLRTGIDESNVAHMYKHLMNVCALEGIEKPTCGEVQRICTNLESLGLIIAEKGRPDLMRKLSLNVSSDDIHYALNC